jgi:hypothetical protein
LDFCDGNSSCPVDASDSHPTGECRHQGCRDLANLREIGTGVFSASWFEVDDRRIQLSPETLQVLDRIEKQPWQDSSSEAGRDDERM